MAIGELLSAEFIKEDESNALYVLTTKQEKMFKCDILATVLAKEKQGSITNVVIDDGSGKIVVRSFEENRIVEGINIGDTILVVGRLRIYNQERYISPEIIKKLSSHWLRLRSLELKKNTIGNSVKTKNVAEFEPLLREKIRQLIGQLDFGPGVLVEELIEKSPIPDAEKIVLELLQDGDIYQIKPGRVKIL